MLGQTYVKLVNTQNRWGQAIDHNCQLSAKNYKLTMLH